MITLLAQKNNQRYKDNHRNNIKMQQNFKKSKIHVDFLNINIYDT